MEIELTQREMNKILKHYQVDGWHWHWWENLQEKIDEYKEKKQIWYHMDLSKLPEKKSSIGTTKGVLTLRKTIPPFVRIDFWVEKTGDFGPLYTHEKLGKGKVENTFGKGVSKQTFIWTHTYDEDKWSVKHEGYLNLPHTKIPVRNLLKSIFGTDNIENINRQITLLEQVKGNPKPRKLNAEEHSYLSKIMTLVNTESDFETAIELAKSLKLFDNLVQQVVSPNLIKRLT